MRGELDASHNESSSGLQRSNKALKSPAVNGSSTNGTLHANGHHQHPSGVERSLSSGAFFGHDREEVTRILIQGLQDLGYRQTAETLTQESGYDLETNSASTFRQAVLAGDWDAAEALLPDLDYGRSESAEQGNSRTPSRTKLALTPEADVQEMLFLLKRQKYLELLEQEEKPAALLVLRQELRPLHQDERRLHALSSLIMCTSAADMRAQAEWDGAGGESRKMLLSALSTCISPAAMIPQHRLAGLLHQVKASAIQHCLYHNTSETPSLYMDHQCEDHDFPTTRIAELTGHDDEIWVAKFSHDGSRLATAGKDQKVLIWDMDTFDQIGSLLTRNSSHGPHSSHESSVTYVCWSPDDSFIVSCSSDKEARVWDSKSRKLLQSIKYHGEPVTSASFAPDGMTFVTGSLDIARPLAVWDVTSRSSTPLYAFPQADYRVRDCAVVAMTPSRYSIEAHLDPESNMEPAPSHSVRLIIVITGSIEVYDYTRREKLWAVDIKPEITCLNLSSDGQEMLLNLSTNEIWALSTVSGSLVRKYSGQKQGEYVVRGCYGGASEGFIVSGGEGPDSDCCVNAVAWNTARPWLWASVGDDKMVNIYSTANTVPSNQRLLQSTRTRSTGSSLPSWFRGGDLLSTRIGSASGAGS